VRSIGRIAGNTVGTYRATSLAHRWVPTGEGNRMLRRERCATCTLKTSTLSTIPPPLNNPEVGNLQALQGYLDH